MEDNYDKLDEFFKRQMQDQTPDASWNVPDDSLFDSAISQVKIEKRKFSYKYLWLLVSLLFMLGIIGAEMERSRTLDDLNTKISELESQLEYLNEKVVKGNNNYKHKESIKYSSEKVDENGTTNDAINYASEDIAMDNVKKTTRSTKSIDSSINQEEAMASYFEDITTISQDVQNSRKEIPANKNVAGRNEIKEAAVAKVEIVGDTNTVLLSMIPPSKFDIRRSNVDMKLINDLQPILCCESPSYWQLGGGFTMNRSNVSMTKLPVGGDAALVGYDQSHGCYGGRMELVYHKTPRWSYDFDISYNRIVNQSYFECDFTFDKSEVYVDDQGVEMYQTDLDMINPMGNQNASVTFRVSDGMEQDDVVQEETNVRQKLDLLGMNAGVSYSLINTPKATIYVGGGFGVDAKLRLMNQFDISLYMDDQEKYHDLTETTEMKGVNDLLLNAHLKAGLTYRVTKRTSFNIDTRYNRSLTSLRDSWPGDGPNTYLHSLVGTVGLRYNLK